MTDTGHGVAAPKISSSAHVPDDIADDIARFGQDGFVGPIKLYEEDEAAELIRQIRVKNQDRSNALYDNNVNYDRHFDIPEQASHATHPTIVKYLTSILGPDVLLWRSEWFPKFPGSKGTEWHQVRDYSYANGKPQLLPTETAWNAYIDITVWTTFTPATRETGCMRFVRGSQRHEIFDEHKAVEIGRAEGYDVTRANTSFFGYNFSDFAIDPNWEPRPEDVVELEMQPGEAVIFTASCVHGSLPNSSERETRIAIAGRYVPTHVRVYPDQDSFTAHGSTFDLSNYGCVLVAGEDRYHHNRLREETNYGEKFRRV
ncbi:chlorinating enzyme [Microbispora sp. RL4-1S]|uniref:Chlorinating enzyme n=1 Tax=Microbispora oryzae TaxID=2806554 RepID=A0A940WMQ2_9ACTN|nr:chlorinating enzyme [Microbispora oryzae]MBP2705858.1 chlorinating enzyme [Microbispora oryzae]